MIGADYLVLGTILIIALMLIADSLRNRKG
jgi:hypothetical protein